MAASKRFVCIHGHFYQPPRENPWLETVETQDTAAPYHDWNERICAECYAPNGAARIVNNKKQIQRIVNNYARISFNFGPTLLSWLKENASRTYRTPDGPFDALAGLDMTVAAGELVAIVGRSGSGKSTLVNLIAGIDRPTAGSVRVAGTAVEFHFAPMALKCVESCW